MTNARKLMAFLIAPLTPLFGLVAVFAVQDLSAAVGLMLSSPSLSLFVLIPSYLSLAFIGLPLIWILRAFGMLNVWSLALSGAVFGALSVFLLFRGFGFETLTDFGRSHILIGAGSGLLVSISYWLLAGGKRGDVEEKNHGAAA